MIYTWYKYWADILSEFKKSTLFPFVDDFTLKQTFNYNFDVTLFDVTWYGYITIGKYFNIIKISPNSYMCSNTLIGIK